MAKTNWTEIDRMNAFSHGEDHYPADDKCFYDFEK
jgi:hypothetical protein